MTEYIEREGLMHELGPYEENNFCQEMSVILQIVAGRPAADVAPVAHGRWMPPAVGKYGCICSVCKKQSDNGYDYCPNCGAKMDKEESEK